MYFVKEEKGKCLIAEIEAPRRVRDGRVAFQRLDYKRNNVKNCRNESESETRYRYRERLCVCVCVCVCVRVRACVREVNVVDN
jgi:hypothetical protein